MLINSNPYPDSADKLVSNAEYHQRFYEAIQNHHHVQSSGNGDATAILLEFLVVHNPELLDDINLEDPGSASVVVELIMTTYE